MSLKKFNYILEKINKLNEKLLVVVIGIMFVILLVQILSRFVFFIPLPSSQDLLIFFLLVSVFLGAGSAVRQNKHIALEFIVNSFPAKIKNKVLIFADLISISFLGIVVYQAIILMVKTKGSTIDTSPIPVSGYYIVVAIGCFLMIMNYINHLTKKLYFANSREEK